MIACLLIIIIIEGRKSVRVVIVRGGTNVKQPRGENTFRCELRWASTNCCSKFSSVLSLQGNWIWKRVQWMYEQSTLVDRHKGVGYKGDSNRTIFPSLVFFISYLLLLLLLCDLFRWEHWLLFRRFREWEREKRGIIADYCILLLILITRVYRILCMELAVAVTMPCGVFLYIPTTTLPVHFSFAFRLLSCCVDWLKVVQLGTRFT